MLQNPAFADAALEKLVQAIVDRVQPVRIVLYGSRARGDDRPNSDYDLFVEVEHGDGRPGYWERVGEIHDAVDPLEIPVDVLVRKPGLLEAQRDDPGRTEWDVAREGIIVYPAGADSTLLRPRSTPLVVREGSTEPPRSIHDWIERAEQDLLDIENNLAGKQVAWATIGFHAQQAAEKFLKALLIGRRIRPPRTHNLGALVARCRRAGCDLPDLSSDCRLLARFAIDVRYPERQPIPDETEGRQVLEAGRRIVAAVRKSLS
jgi:HEPN domain-containing protein/predicted nucleotidyltransferase